MKYLMGFFLGFAFFLILMSPIVNHLTHINITLDSSGLSIYRNKQIFYNTSRITPIYELQIKDTEKPKIKEPIESPEISVTYFYYPDENVYIGTTSIWYHNDYIFYGHFYFSSNNRKKEVEAQREKAKNFLKNYFHEK